jgi:hypothetical protein
MASERSGQLIVTPQPVETFAYAAPLEWRQEPSGEWRLHAPASPISAADGVIVRPLDQPDLAERFVSLDGSLEAYARFFQPLGHPLMGLGKTYPGIQPVSIGAGELRFFQAKLEFLLTAAGAARQGHAAAREYVAQTRRRRWRMRWEGTPFVSLSRTLVDDVAVERIRSVPEPERASMALHLHLEHVVQELIRDRYVVRSSAARSAAFTYWHDLYVQPTDLLGAVLQSALLGIQQGRTLRRCSECGRIIHGNAKRRTCNDPPDLCRKRRSRRLRAARDATPA